MRDRPSRVARGHGGARLDRNSRAAMISSWRRFRMLGRQDRGLVIEAAVLLPSAWIGLRLLPFVKLRSVLDAYANRSRTPGGTTIDRTTWAVNAAADRSPISMTCLVRALAADTM